MRKYWIMAGCAALAACNNMPEDAGDDQVPEQGVPASRPMPVEPDGGIGDMPGGTPAPGDASAPEQTAPPAPRPMLQNMTRDEFSNAIASGLGCSFQSGPQDGILLVATAPDDNRANGEGVVKIGDVPTVMPFSGKGYGALESGGTFRTNALTITVKRGTGPGKKVGIETMSWPATMTIKTKTGGENSYAGTYACGA